MMWGPVVLAALCFLVYVDCVSAFGLGFFKSSSLHLRILHTNDIHSRIRESDKWGVECFDSRRNRTGCYGGVARIAQKVRELKSRHKNTLFLNAGGFFRGTLWYSVLKHKIASYAMTKMGYDAIGLGNNEFDDGPQELAPFVRALRKAGVPVLGTNVDTSREPIFKGVTLPRSHVITLSGFKVALLSVVTPNTATIAKPGRVKILPVADSINREIWRLKSQGVKIFILVSHVGFDVDQRLAVACPELDVIVGGHSETFLYTGTPPTQEDKRRVEGSYPFLVTRRGRPDCVIVQAYRYGKYLGNLELTFNRKGDITHWRGRPILLDQRIGQDHNILRGLVPYETIVKDALKKVVGSTKVLLEAKGSVCRFRECNLGNLVADSFLDFYANRKSKLPHAWSDVNAAVINGGAAREAITQNSNVTLDNLYRAMPVDTELVLLTMNGSQLHRMFEHAVADFTWSPDLHGKFLQVSGIRVDYDLGRPAGWRVAWMKILCANCSVPRYEDVHFKKRYSIVTTSFIANGGDGFKFDEGILKISEGISAFDVFTKYFTKLSPIKTAVEGRIVVKNLPSRGNPLSPVQPPRPAIAPGQTPISRPMPGHSPNTRLGPGQAPSARLSPSQLGPVQAPRLGPASSQLSPSQGRSTRPSLSQLNPVQAPRIGVAPSQLSPAQTPIPGPAQGPFGPVEVPTTGLGTGQFGQGKALVPEPTPEQLGPGQAPTGRLGAGQFGQGPTPMPGPAQRPLGPRQALSAGLGTGQFRPGQTQITRPAPEPFGSAQAPSTGQFGRGQSSNAGPVPSQLMPAQTQITLPATGRLGLGQTSIQAPAPSQALSQGFPPLQAHSPGLYPTYAQDPGVGQTQTPNATLPTYPSGTEGWSSS